MDIKQQERKNPYGFCGHKATGKKTSIHTISVDIKQQERKNPYDFCGHKAPVKNKKIKKMSEHRHTVSADSIQFNSIQETLIIPQGAIFLWSIDSTKRDAVRQHSDWVITGCDNSHQRPRTYISVSRDSVPTSMRGVARLQTRKACLQCSCETPVPGLPR